MCGSGTESPLLGLDTRRGGAVLRDSVTLSRELAAQVVSPTHLPAQDPAAAS